MFYRIVSVFLRLVVEKINQWFISNKLSLNIKQYIKYKILILWLKLQNTQITPLLLPKLTINNYEPKRIEVITFLGEFIKWKLKLVGTHLIQQKWNK